MAKAWVFNSSTIIVSSEVYTHITNLLVHPTSPIDYHKIHYLRALFYLNQFQYGDYNSVGIGCVRRP
jgi:hypothetical protein